MAGKHHTKIPNYEGIFNFTYDAHGMSHAFIFSARQYKTMQAHGLGPDSQG